MPEDAFVFCCFSNLAKLSPSCFDAWCNILRRVPNSVLWLLRFPTPLVEPNLLAEARKRGVKGPQVLKALPTRNTGGGGGSAFYM